jgi:acyl carrier protein
MDLLIADELQALVSARSGRTIDAADRGDFIRDHGLDLFDLSEIVVAIEDKFGFDIPDSDLPRISSMADCIEYTGERMAEIRSWIRSEE